jgi:hypothetical protein
VHSTSNSACGATWLDYCFAGCTPSNQVRLACINQLALSVLGALVQESTSCCFHLLSLSSTRVLAQVSLEGGQLRRRLCVQGCMGSWFFQRGYSCQSQGTSAALDVCT